MARNPFARITGRETDEQIEAIALEHGLEPMTPGRRRWRALAERAYKICEALEDRPAELEAWLRDGEARVAKLQRKAGAA